jgi:thiol-disulfide isomerase/thioredoxin
MKRALLALFTALLAVSGCTTNGSDGDGFRFTEPTALGTVIPAADRQPAGTFTGELIDGGTLGSTELRGKVSLLNFWASWCGPCRIEAPQLDLLYREVKDDDVRIIGVDTKDDKGNARAFVRDFDISYPIVFDEQGEVALRLGDIPARGLPFSVLLDKSGKVAAVYFGQLTAKDLQGPLDTLTAEHAAAEQQR